ncbi:hypothetical protein [Nigerium massiliense]|uniref:hypothetical protein n=1 Tax=Nigerium massiliense TaxID=1522317 RepID=UPI00058E91E9|nr:hypothetical protein [Nigerium massiliense]
MIAAAVVAGIIIAATFLNRPQDIIPGSNPSSGAPAPSASGPGMPFAMPSNPDAGGRWEILNQEWVDGGVLLDVAVYADRGLVTYGFVAFQNNGTEVLRPGASPRQPEMGTGTLVAGSTKTGWVYIPMERGSATLILTTSGGRQISALPIKA